MSLDLIELLDLGLVEADKDLIPFSWEWEWREFPALPRPNR
ncbi:hypothetical protein [Cryobacterium cryoconiti]|nr:hypothetical protein [Cryobacterium cryoconiti]